MFSFAIIAIATLASRVEADELPTMNAETLEFFESKVRPVLVKHCYGCHSAGAEELRAGLRLDSRQGLLTGGDSGPAIVSGKPDESLLVESVRYESNEMPPDGKLEEAEVSALVKWVELGAPWPAESSLNAAPRMTGYDWQKARDHWAFQPVRGSEPPATVDHARVRNKIDPFVASRLQAAGLSQAEAAAAGAFVRRAFIDLIGLPPTPRELDDWVRKLDAGDRRELNDEAVLELINSLLDRPQYGERWGRQWLDVARYSDTGGWTQDNRPHPMAWRYRDWVIAAFNEDMPFNEFVRCQLAGDQIDRGSSVGTGFLALGPTYSSDGGDPESVAQAKSETLDDRVDTFSRAFLGLTVSCARCHDHKFDPIPTQDYYSIAGIFNNAREGETPLVDENVVREFNDAQRAISELQDKINKEKQKASKDKREPTADETQRIESWQKELDERRTQAPPKYDFAHTIHDSGSSDMHVALRGNLLKKGPLAPRRFLKIVEGEQRQHFSEGSGRRRLAAAVVDPSNPLTPRVIVNRVWLGHFGRALVRTPNNFGTLGERPTHPDLLDWLAASFIESGWSIKSLHRLIMTSATYRSGSQFHQGAFSIDGDNRLLWRVEPRRMDAETWRDSLLSITGELDLASGGPSIDNILGSRRRTLYAKISRNNPLESDNFLRMFDFPIPRASSAKRNTSVIPQQFLFMMNSEFMLDRARALDSRLQAGSLSPEQRISKAYRLLYGRLPSPKEVTVGKQFVNSTTSDNAQLTRWQQYCQVLLSSNEFMYVR